MRLYSGRAGYRVSCGSGALALVATQSNLSLVNCMQLTNSARCLHFGRFAVCIAGDVTTGFRCDAPNDKGYQADLKIEEASAKGLWLGLQSHSLLSRYCAKRPDLRISGADHVYHGAHFFETGTNKPV